ncbi:YoaK family protein [Streptomyces sp. NPDC096339]|uniref:YoaK family protein n=1 Tax=Streptomyces sp. NPDC096339 TaxID=3366086 RepID=UPI00381165DE
MSTRRDQVGVSLSGLMDEGPRLPALMIVLTVATGLVEAVSLLALGPVFTAMQTGNVLFLAFGAARAGNLPALPSAVSLAAFVLGVLCGALLESVTEARGRRWFIIGLTVEGVLVLAAAGIGWGLEPRYGAPTARHLLVTGVLAFALGIRNLTIMRAHLPGVPTTLITRSMTAFFGGPAMGQGGAFAYRTPAWQLRGLSVLAMFAGGFVGALLVQAGWTVGRLLLPIAVLVLASAAAELGQPRLHSGQFPDGRGSG